MSALPEVTSIYYISPEETNIFNPKGGQNVVSAINIRMNLSFAVANNVVSVEDIIQMNHVDDTLTDTERYNARILCHYIATGDYAPQGLVS